MNDFLAFEAISATEFYLVLRHPQKGGAIDICKMAIPTATVRDIVADPSDFVDRLASFISFVDAGLFDWT